MRIRAHRLTHNESPPPSPHNVRPLPSPPICRRAALPPQRAALPGAGDCQPQQVIRQALLTSPQIRQNRRQLLWKALYYAQVNSAYQPDWLAILARPMPPSFPLPPFRLASPFFLLPSPPPQSPPTLPCFRLSSVAWNCYLKGHLASRWDSHTSVGVA